MKTKLPLLFITGLVAVGPITSCGPKSNRSSDPNEITVAIVSDTAEEETLNNFIKNYLALPGNEGKSITMVKMTNYDDYIEDSFLYDDLADIIQVYDYNCEYYANANIDGAGTSLLQPISSYMARDGIQESDFYDSIIEMTKCKTGSNEVYWAPRDYNKVVCGDNGSIGEEKQFLVFGNLGHSYMRQDVTRTKDTFLLVEDGTQQNISIDESFHQDVSLAILA